jgi:hypothetical protein
MLMLVYVGVWCGVGVADGSGGARGGAKAQVTSHDIEDIATSQEG